MIIKSVNLETVCGITSKLPENQFPEIAFAGKSNVIFVNNVVNTAEVKEKLKAYLGI